MLKGILHENIFTYALCLAGSTFYMYGLSFESSVIQNVSSLSFTLLLVAVFFINVKKLNAQDSRFPYFIIIQLFLLNFAIAISALVFKIPEYNFLVQDSLLTHLPESLKYVSFLKGETDFKTVLAINTSGKLTHTTTAAFITVFGINFFSTIMAQLVFKLITVACIYIICKNLWNEKTASLAILLYGLCPTVFFYNLVLYKESAVQALFAIALLSVVKIFIKEKYLFLLPLSITFYLLLNERFYVAYLFLPMIYLMTLVLIFNKSKKLFYIVTSTTIIFTVFSLFYFSDFVIAAFLKIHQQRLYHSSFTDNINQFNYQIPYPLAFIKIIFSPYFSLNKFNIFTGLSSLLTWGSFINQIIILSAFLGLLRSTKQNFFHLYLWSAFIIFLLLAAYVSPWSGRVRDSFYPLIACYAAYYLANNSFFKKYFIKVS